MSNKEDMSTRENRGNMIIIDIFKSSLVGILAVLLTVIPFEQFIAQFVGLSYEVFRGGMPTLYLFPLFLIYAAIALIFLSKYHDYQLQKIET